MNAHSLYLVRSFNDQRRSLIERKDILARDQASIDSLVSGLDTQKEEAILRTFRGVSRHFSEVFAELVPGGEGKLIMLTTMDVDDALQKEDEDEDGILNLAHTSVVTDTSSVGADGASASGVAVGKSNKSRKSSSASSKQQKQLSVGSFQGVQVKVSFSGSGVDSSQQYEMQQLSGGQKSLVALALIFAIQRYLLVFNYWCIIFCLG